MPKYRSRALRRRNRHNHCRRAMPSGSQALPASAKDEQRSSPRRPGRGLGDHGDACPAFLGILAVNERWVM